MPAEHQNPSAEPAKIEEETRRAKARATNALHEQLTGQYALVANEYAPLPEAELRERYLVEQDPMALFTLRLRARAEEANAGGRVSSSRSAQSVRERVYGGFDVTQLLFLVWRGDQIAAIVLTHRLSNRLERYARSRTPKSRDKSFIAKDALTRLWESLFRKREQHCHYIVNRDEAGTLYYLQHHLGFEVGHALQSDNPRMPPTPGNAAADGSYDPPAMPDHQTDVEPGTARAADPLAEPPAANGEETVGDMQGPTLLSEATEDNQDGTAPNVAALPQGNTRMQPTGDADWDPIAAHGDPSIRRPGLDPEHAVDVAIKLARAKAVIRAEACQERILYCLDRYGGEKLDRIALLNGLNRNTVRTRIYTIQKRLHAKVNQVEEGKPVPGLSEPPPFRAADVDAIEQLARPTRTRVQQRLAEVHTTLDEHDLDWSYLLAELMLYDRTLPAASTLESALVQAGLAEPIAAMSRLSGARRLAVALAVKTGGALERIAETLGVQPPPANIPKAISNFKLYRTEKFLWISAVRQEHAPALPEIAGLLGVSEPMVRFLAGLRDLPCAEREALLMWDALRAPLEELPDFIGANPEEIFRRWRTAVHDLQQAGGIDAH